MPRNFDGRYELLFPVVEPAAKRTLLDELDAQLRDDVNAFELTADAGQAARWGGHSDAQRADGHVEHVARDAGPLGDEHAA